MGYWENTAYIKSKSTTNVVNELSAMFAEEGMVLVPAPKKRDRQSYEPMQYALALKNNLWGVAVFPGIDNWVIIKTAPLELLGEKDPNKSKIRFVSLCSRLNCLGFFYNVYDSGSEILIETVGNETYEISGFSYSNPDDYYGETLDVNESNFEIQFKVLPFQYILEDNANCDDRASALAEKFAGTNKNYCDNVTSVDILITHKSFEAKGGKALYYKWPNDNRVEIDSTSWEEWSKKNS